MVDEINTFLGLLLTHYGNIGGLLDEYGDSAIASPPMNPTDLLYFRSGPVTNPITYNVRFGTLELE